MVNEEPYIHSDVALSRRLEKAEAQSNVEFVIARAKAFPDSGAEWIEVAGAYAMFDGVRNAERQGFRIAYTRIKWRLGSGGGE